MVKSQLLNKIVGSPNSEYKYAFQLPPDLYHGPRTTWNSTASDTSTKTPFTEFERFQNQLLADVDHIKIDYQVNVAEKDMPHYLIEMMVRALMAEVALSVTDQQNVKDEALASAWGLPSENNSGGYFREASRIDSMVRPPSRVKSFPLTEVRNS